MARPLLSLSHHPLPALPSLLLLATIAAVASIIISLCTTHKHKKHASEKFNSNNNITPIEFSSSPQNNNKDHKKLISTLSGISSVKAMVVAKMVSWKRGGEETDGEDELWRKSILMGEKCRPLDFSGQIVYDSEGNEVKKELLQSSSC